MDTTDVFAKTPDGQAEVATRARRIPARMRSMLIMVDGKRSVGDMLAHHPAAEEARASLIALRDAGLIAAVPGLATASSAPLPQPVVHGDVSAIKRFVCQALHETLGVDADLFTAKIEAAPSLQDLLAQAEKMREVLRSAGGNGTADAFWHRLDAMLTPG